jgi:hypothetical protein
MFEKKSTDQLSQLVLDQQQHLGWVTGLFVYEPGRI